VGIQENVMSYWTILPTSIKFVVLLAVGTAFFSELSTMGVMDNQAIRTDVIASSMCLINMHNSTEVRIGWDRVPFTMAFPEAALVTYFDTKRATVSPYPLVVPVKGYEDIDGTKYFVGKGIEKFNFTSTGPEVIAK